VEVRSGDWSGNAVGGDTGNKFLLKSLTERSAIERMRAACVLRNQGSWTSRGVDDPQDTVGIDFQTTEVARLPSTNICPRSILAQGNQPENGLASVEPGYGLAVSLIPFPPYTREKETEQGRVVKSSTNALLHA